ncbi:hypothetical protein Nepgr_010431 [Nepenthes gracilis]|uniref:Uncharacterized protein n=1 Tax=Nepenthes gracilis TaxID=150966 RepID=A0AAD3SD43_NEPGR|nr:hypothetical protein Nepgr_010431 [Nepenthes gracilis]
MVFDLLLVECIVGCKLLLNLLLNSSNRSRRCLATGQLQKVIAILCLRLLWARVVVMELLCYGESQKDCTHSSLVASIPEARFLADDYVVAPICGGAPSCSDGLPPNSGGSSSGMLVHKQNFGPVSSSSGGLVKSPSVVSKTILPNDLSGPCSGAPEAYRAVAVPGFCWDGLCVELKVWFCDGLLYSKNFDAVVNCMTDGADLGSVDIVVGCFWKFGAEDVGVGKSCLRLMASCWNGLCSRSFAGRSIAGGFCRRFLALENWGAECAASFFAANRWFSMPMLLLKVDWALTVARVNSFFPVIAEHGLCSMLTCGCVRCSSCVVVMELLYCGDVAVTSLDGSSSLYKAVCHAVLAFSMPIAGLLIVACVAAGLQSAVAGCSSAEVQGYV